MIERSSTLGEGPSLRFRALGGVSIGSNAYALELVEGDRPVFRLLLDAGLSITPDNKLDVDAMEQVRRVLKDKPPGQRNGVQAIVVSHVHEDHAGMLPWIVRYCRESRLEVPEGWICMSLVSRDLFLDSQMELYDSVYGVAAERTRREAALFYWDKNDVQQAYWKTSPIAFGSMRRILSIGNYEAHLRLLPAGHILGSAMVELEFRHLNESIGRVLYTGDFCQRQASFLVKNAYRTVEGLARERQHYNALIVEGTYYLDPRYRGNVKEIKRELARIIARTFEEGGNAVLIVYSLDRAQQTLACLREILDGVETDSDMGVLKEYVPIDIFFDTRVGGTLLDEYKRYIREVLKLTLDARGRADYQGELREEVINRYDRTGFDPFKLGDGREVCEYVWDRGMRKYVLDKYRDGCCIVVTTSATGCPSPVHEYLHVWGGREENLFLTMGRPAPSMPMTCWLNEYERKPIRLSIWDEGKGDYVESDVKVEARLEAFDLISAHATSSEIEQIMARLSYDKIIMVHIGGEPRELLGYKRSGAIERLLKAKGVSAEIPWHREAFLEIPLRRPERIIALPEDVWDWIESQARLFYPGEPFSREVAVKTLRRMRQMFKDVQRLWLRKSRGGLSRRRSS